MTEERAREIHEMIWGEIVEQLEFAEKNNTDNHYISIEKIKMGCVSHLRYDGYISTHEYELLEENSYCALCMYDEVFEDGDGYCCYCRKKGFDTYNSQGCLKGRYFKMMTDITPLKVKVDIAREIRDLYKELDDEDNNNRGTN